MNKVLLSTMCAVLLISGCAKYQAEAGQENFTNAVDKITTAKIDDLGKEVKEKKVEPKYISLARSKTVKQILEGLQDIDGKIYHIYGSRNLYLPKNRNVKIYDVDDLIIAMEAFTDKTLVPLDKNKYFKNRVKVFNIVDKAEVRDNITIKPFSLSKNIVLPEALDILMANTNFSVVYNNNDFLLNSAQGFGPQGGGSSSFLDQTFKVDFKGRNVAEFLVYVSKSLDVFVDVDYKNKLIEISKYKARTYAINNLDVVLEGELGASNIQGAEAIGGSGELQKQVSLSIYKNITENLEKYIANENSLSTNKNMIMLDNFNGGIMVVGTPRTHKDVAYFMSETNDGFTRSCHLTIKMYEILVNRSQTLGTDLSIQTGNGAFDLSTNFIKNKTLSIIEDGTTNDYALFLDSLNQYGTLAYVTEFLILAKNNVPVSDSDQTTEDYIKRTVIQKTPSGDQIITDTTQEIDQTSDGISYIARAKIFDGKADVSLSINLGKTLDLQEKSIDADGNTVTLPKVIKREYDKNFNIRDGETIKIIQYSDYSTIDRYEGILPLEDFIIGGQSSASWVKRNIIITVSAKFTTI